PSWQDSPQHPPLGQVGADLGGDALGLGLLGGFELRAGARPVRLPLHVQRLLAFLALQGRPLHRAYVAGRLWSELSQERAHACLRTTLWRMRRLPRPLVEATSTHVALAGAVTVDTRELEACAERALRNGDVPVGEDVDRLIRRADLLPDWYDDWLVQER